MIRCKKCMPFDHILAPQCEVCGETFVLGDVTTPAKTAADKAVIEAAVYWLDSDGSMDSIERLTLAVLDYLGVQR